MNDLSLSPKELAALLAKTIPAKLPVLIKGAPGIGKSELVAQAADEAGANLIIDHPVVADPTDAKGLPAVVDGEAVFLPFGNLKKWMNAKSLTVVLLDDFGQAPAMVQAAYMQPILAREVAGHKISDHVVFIVATNRREDKAGVTGILEPVKSRFCTIVELAPNVNDWCEWALHHDVPPELVAFVRFRPELFLSPGAPTNDIVNRPSPRTVTQLGRLLKAGIDSLAPLAGATGVGFATEFLGFLKVYQSLPSIDAILIKPDTAEVPDEPAALYAVATALAARVSQDNAGRIVKYASRMPDEFGVLCLRDSLRACPAAAKNKEFVKWAVDHQDVLA